MPVWTATTSTTAIWNNWTTVTTGSSTGVTAAWDNVWATWNTSGTNTITTITTTPYRRETEEEREERRRRDLEAAQRREAATERARDLLRLVLSDEQWADFEAGKSFHVIGSDGGRYRVRYGTTGNVALVRDDQVIERLCAHPRLYEIGGVLPTEDVLAAQVLALRHDEAGFRAVANITRCDVARAA